MNNVIYYFLLLHHLLVLHYLSVRLDASPPRRVMCLSCHQLLHHLPLLLLFDKVLGNTSPPALPLGQILVQIGIRWSFKLNKANHHSSPIRTMACKILKLIEGCLWFTLIPVEKWGEKKDFTHVNQLMWASIHLLTAPTLHSGLQGARTYPIYLRMKVGYTPDKLPVNYRAHVGVSTLDHFPNTVVAVLHETRRVCVLAFVNLCKKCSSPSET